MHLPEGAGAGTRRVQQGLLHAIARFRDTATCGIAVPPRAGSKPRALHTSMPTKKQENETKQTSMSTGTLTSRR